MCGFFVSIFYIWNSKNVWNVTRRSRRALEYRKNMDEERLYVLEQNLKDTTEAAVESEKRYDEVSLWLHLHKVCVFFAVNNNNNNLGRRLSEKSRESPETFLFQRCSVLLQRFNAVLLHDSMPAHDRMEF